MGSRSENQLNTMLRIAKRRKWQTLMLLCLAVGVIVGVAGIFHHTGIAKTYQVTELSCTAVPPEGAACADFFVHIHNDDCFDAEGNLRCPLPEIKPHRHTAECYSTTRELICTTPESDGHQHTEDCYTRVQGDLICTLPTEPVLDEAGNVLEEGHVHTDECFAWTEELSCGMEEGQGAHHHDDSCYETMTTLICTEPEILLHTHTDACYQKNEDGSIYVDEDGNSFLICGQMQVLEHVHGPECFTVYELDDGEAGSTENTEGEEGGLVFLFPEEGEEEEQPAESANPEAETGDTDAPNAGNTDPADGSSGTEDAGDAGDAENKENTESDDNTGDTDPNAEGETPETASVEEPPVAEEPHEVVYTGTRGAEKGGMTVLAEIPEGALDENVQLILGEADENNARKQILKVVNEFAAEGEEREISSMLLLDIGFVSGGEPAVLNGLDPIRVTLRAAAIRTMSAPKLFHLSGGTAREVEDVLFDTQAGSVVFTSSSFSPFAVVELSGEELAEETVEETVGDSMPAQSFTGETGGVIVSVEAPEGAFPEGTTMVVTQVEMDDETLSNVTGAVESSGEKKVVTTQAVDISFFDAEQNLIEPKLPIKVSMKSALVSESENVALVHLAETGAAETAETETSEAPAATTAEVVTDVQVVENPDEDNEIQFESDAFSVYVLVGTETITTRYLTADGQTYLITVTCGPEAGIPQGAQLRVQEIVPTVSESEVEPAPASDAYGEYLAKTESALPVNQKVTYARFFDITILSNGEEIQPLAPVEVTIELADEVTAEEIKAVHFTGDSAETEQPVVLDAVGAEASAENMTNAVSFSADGFSVYGIVGTETVTVDFLTADGKTLTIRVTFDHREVLPAGAMLDVSEVIYEDNPDVYAQRNERLAGVLFEKYGNVAITDVRYLNISIMVPDENLGGSESAWVEYEPVYPMEVKISYTEPMDTTNPGVYQDYNDGSTKVIPDIGNHIVGVHYAEAGAEILDTVNENTAAGVSETVIQTDGFSEYDFAYIFEYEIIDTHYNYEPSSMLEIAPNLTLMARAAEGGLLRGAGDPPDHSKTLIDNHDGTHKLSLTVTGDADTDNTTASNANVVIVFDTSNSMINYYVPMEYGGRGSNKEDGADSYVLYYKDGNKYREVSDGYTGTVYRKSGNSYTRYTGQRYSKTIRRADAAEKALYDFAHALYGYQNQDDPSTAVDESKNIQTALITFNRTATTVQGWTSKETDITNRVSSTGNGGSKKLGNSSGTNWEAALQQARTVINSADNDPTFVVFITDGQPTQVVGTPDGTYITDGTPYVGARDDAYAVQQACAATGTDSHGALFGIYAYGTEADYLDDMMYYAYTGTVHTEDLEAAGEETFETEGYYNAGDSAALADAINDIFSKIVNTLGITAVSIQDGTTSQVQTTSGEISHLLEVDTGSYEYWLSFPTVDNKIKMKDLVTGEDVECTVSSSGSNVTISWSKGGTAYSETYEGTYSSGTARIKWDRATSFYNYAPPSASFTDPSVDWNLSSLGTLLDGVTYEVTFDVYPSQETLDYIADLKNSKIQYEDLDANIREYLIKNGNDYTLKTNTSASLSYTDTRTDNGPQSSLYENPEPVRTSAVKALTIAKKWENALDGRAAEPMQLYVTRDNKWYYEVEMSNNNDWSNSAFVSIGLMTIHNGVVSVKDPGHDFSFAEPDNLAYYWEIDVPTVHPMWINGEDNILVQVSGNDIPEAMTEMTAPAQYESNSETYFKINYLGADKYYKVDNALASLTATNTRRSSLNVTKTVTGSNAPADALFDFTVRVKDANNDDVWFSIWDGSSYVTNTEEITYINGATAETNTSGTLTGFYHAPSGTEITFKLQAGWNLRFTNLPTGTTYEVTESSTMPDECFDFVSVSGDREYYVYSDGSETPTKQHAETGDVDGQTIEGTIANTNSTYTMTYTNNWTTVDVMLEKLDQDGKKLSGSAFKLERLNKNGEWVTVAENITPGKEEDTTPAVSNPVDLNGLGVGRYKLTETTIPKHYTAKAGTVYFEVYKEDNTLRVRLTDEDGQPITEPVEGVSLSGPEDGTYTISAENVLSTQWIQFKKTDASGNVDGHELPGAEFTFKIDNDNTYYLTSGSDGLLATTETATEPVKKAFELVMTDTPYELIETKAPDGYNDLAGTVKVYVQKNGGNAVSAALVGADGTMILKQYDVIYDTSSGAAPAGSETNPYVVIIINNPGVVLPQTGGEGTLIFTVLGTILVLSSTLLILAKRKQEAYIPRH